MRYEHEAPTALDPRPSEAAGDQDPDVEPLQILTGRLVSLRQITAALRRTRRVWLTLAALGFAVALGYHFLVPLQYTGTATLYLHSPANTTTTAASKDDLAMLQTTTVGDKAIASLGAHGRGLSPQGLLGSNPGTMAGGNVLVLSISGPTQATAVRRVDAVAHAYLAFRAKVFEDQERALVAASSAQLPQLQAQVKKLAAQIAAAATTATPQQLASLQAQAAAATAQLIGIQQSIQQSSIDTLSVVHGSRVITPGTVVGHSKVKVILLDGLTGLGAGLGLGLGAVIVWAALSDRIRRREDLAALLGAPVAMSVGRVGPRIFRGQRAWLPSVGRASLATLRARATPGRPLGAVAHFLRAKLAPDAPYGTELVVAVDDASASAAALGALAGTLSAPGHRVVLVDDTRNRALGHLLGAPRRTGRGHLDVDAPPSADGWPDTGVALGTGVTLVVMPRPWEADDDTSLGILDDLGVADAVLVLATVDPGEGAGHLRRWGRQAIVTVSAGGATAHTIAAVHELLDAAQITVSSVVLFDADPTDDSVGLVAAPVAAVADDERLALLSTNGAASAASAAT